MTTLPRARSTGRKTPYSVVVSLCRHGLTDEEILPALLADGVASLNELAMIGVRHLAANARREEARRIEAAAEKAKMRDAWAQQLRKNAAERAEIAKANRAAAQAADAALAQAISDLYLSTTEARDRFAAQLKMRWTAELLRSSFDLGDGRRVTWGEATESDHLARMSLLDAHAVGTIATSARHAAAVTALRQAGASCLAEIRAAAA